MKEKDIREIDVNMKENIVSDENGIKWYDLNNPYLKGSAFHNDFKRLPNGVFVSENIETLKNHPAGMYIEFKTNSKDIRIKAKLTGQAYMAHMTACATIGFDIYVKHEGKWVFLAVTKVNAKEYDVQLLKNLDSGEREFRVYFPLYQAVTEAYIGINEESSFSFINDKKEKIVVYGTSISQGGCSSRPGLCYSSILGRMLDMEVINLGFSGSCKIEEVMVDVINQIDKKYLILEVEANSPGVDIFNERLTYFLKHLNNKDDFKIYLISHFDDGMCLVNTEYRNVQKAFYDAQKNNFKGLKFIDGSKLIHELGYEGTVDGVHLNDLGFYEVARKLAEIIRNDSL